jgi:hypothetical protein
MGDTLTIRLTPEDVMPEPEAAMAHGDVPVILSLSAYDTPSSLNVENPGGGILRISFDYVDREARVARPVDDDLTVFVGKNSGKVLGFEVRRNARKPREIAVRIVEGVDAQLRSTTRPNQRLNYKLIKRVVSSKLEPLLAGT